MSDDGAGPGAGGGGSERQVPFFCPYCGDESLRPSGPDAGGWTCGSCARSFRLSFAGLAGSGAVGSGAVGSGAVGSGARP